MSLDVPDSALTSNELARIAGFRREVADALDEALVDGAGVFTETDDGLVPAPGAPTGRALLDDGSWGDVQSSLYFDVTDPAYGATGDGVTDDSAAIRLAVTAAVAAGGGTVYFPNGTYIVSNDGAHPWCIKAESNVRFLGQSRVGSIIYMADAQTINSRMFSTGNDEAAYHDVEWGYLTLDGNKTNQPANPLNEHQPNIFLTRCSRAYIHDLNSVNAQGDAVDIHNDGNDDEHGVIIERCTFENNQRYGVVCNGGNQSRITIRDCVITENFGDAFHIELPGGFPVFDILIENCYMTIGNTGDSTVAFRGADSFENTLSRRIVLRNNYIVGWVFINLVADVLIEGNSIYAETDEACIYVQQTCHDVKIVNNYLNAEAGLEGIKIVGAGGAWSDRLYIAGNEIYAPGSALEMQNVTNVRVHGNLMACTDPDTVYGGLTLRASDTTTSSIHIANNHIRDFKISLVLFGDNNIEDAVIIGNVFELVDSNTLVGAMDLDEDGAHGVQQATAIGNSMLGGVPAMFVGLSTGDGYPACPVLIGGSRGDRGLYSCTGTPASAIVENIGAMALDRAGGSGTTLYVKESGNGASTGWVAK